MGDDEIRTEVFAHPGVATAATSFNARIEATTMRDSCVMRTSVIAFSGLTPSVESVPTLLLACVSMCPDD